MLLLLLNEIQYNVLKKHTHTPADVAIFMPVFCNERSWKNVTSIYGKLTKEQMDVSLVKQSQSNS